MKKFTLAVSVAFALLGCGGAPFGEGSATTTASEAPGPTSPKVSRSLFVELVPDATGVRKWLVVRNGGLAASDSKEALEIDDLNGGDLFSGDRVKFTGIDAFPTSAVGLRREPIHVVDRETMKIGPAIVPGRQFLLLDASVSHTFYLQPDGRVLLQEWVLKWPEANRGYPDELRFLLGS